MSKSKVIYKCRYCRKEIANKGSLSSHELRCKLNPNRIEFKKSNQYIKSKELGLEKPKPSGNAIKKKRIVYNTVCPICGKMFSQEITEFIYNKIKNGEYVRKVRKFCSRECTLKNSRKCRVFERGLQYREKAISKFGNKCIICNFSDIVEVHHIDGNHSNNEISNLVPLCPNHHRMIHVGKWKKTLTESIYEVLSRDNVTVA